MKMKKPETKQITIGNYQLRTNSLRPEKVWIESILNDGEGGEFLIKKLEEVIHDFYKKYF